jgi:deoxyadenosine/deoxycytidine kinase
MDPPIITIGGNIGCGKSTIIHNLESYNHDNVLPEPINEWGSWLELFYKDQSKYAFGFQMQILLSFFKNMDDMKTRSKKYKPIVTERSPIDSLEVFAKILVDKQVLCQIEYDLFKDYVKTIGWVPQIFIYIRTSPHVCVDRIKKRGRYCESSLDENYIKTIHSYYEDLQTNLTNSDTIQMFIVDGNQDQDDVFLEVLDIVSNIQI